VIASGRRLGFAAVCSELSLGQMRAQVSHSVVVEGLSLSRKGGSLFNQEFERLGAALLTYFAHIFGVIQLKGVQWPSVFSELRVSSL
jgi:hypothetical protein